MIVDDIATNMKVAKGLLAPYKTTVDIFQNAAAAIETIKETEYDIVFMDHMMPDIDGIEAAGIIRSLDGESFKTVPIIALTANAFKDDIDMAMASGMNGHIAKPVEENVLFKTLFKFIGKK